MELPEHTVLFPNKRCSECLPSGMLLKNENTRQTQILLLYWEDPVNFQPIDS